MLSKLRALLSAQPSGTSPSGLDATQVAVCVLLLEAAVSDEDFTEAEHALVRRVLRQRFQLAPEAVEQVVAEAREAQRESYDLWQFTHEINESHTQAEKVAIMEDIWRVLYSDGHLDGDEDHLAHKLRHLLNLSHPQFIAAKMTVLREVRGE